MTELLHSPLFYAILWSLLGSLQVAVSYARKEPLGFFHSIQSLVFGPVALATELLQLAFSTRNESTASASIRSLSEVDQAYHEGSIVPIDSHDDDDHDTRIIKWNPADPHNRKKHGMERKGA